MRRLPSIMLAAVTTVRGVASLIMLIMAGGRLGLWSASPRADLLGVSTYGILLLISGAFIVATGKTKSDEIRRVASAIGATLLFGMAWDTGVSTTALIEATLGIALAFSTVYDDG